MSQRQLGEILLENGSVTRLQVSEALQIQKEERARLGEVLVLLGFVTKRQIRQVIREFKKRIPLGEYLLEAGVITPEDLDYALAQKANSREPLGQVLVRLGAIDEEQLARFLSEQLDMPYIEPYQRLVDMSLFNRLPRSFIVHNTILPLHEIDDVVTVVAPGLPDEATAMQLAAVFGDNIDYAISTPTKIKETIKSLLERRSMPDIEMQTDSGIADGEAALRVDLSQNPEEQGLNEYKAVEWLNYIVREALREGASDIHIESMPENLQVRFRINGLLTHKMALPLGARSGLFRRIKALAGMKFADSFRNQHGRLLGEMEKTNVDLRVSTLVGINGEAVNLRLFSQELGVMDLNDIGLTPNAYGMLRRALDCASGLIVFCGPPGSGKTTSMFASLNRINGRHLKVVTVEDPVEYQIPGAVQTQLSAHRECTLAQVLDSVLHQDPDVIVIGELRQDEDVRVALRAALTGYKVLTTFHANDVLGALLRLFNDHLDTFMRSSTPFTLVCQRLVRRVCENCKVVIAAEPRLVGQFPIRDFEPEKYDFCHGTGCARCNNSGYSGRTSILEALTITEELRHAFARRTSAQEFLKLARSATPFLTISEIGALKAIRQVTTVKEIIRVAPFSFNSVMESDMLSLQEIEHISESSGLVE